MFQSKTVKGSAIRVRVEQVRPAAAGAQGNANLEQAAASEEGTIDPIKRPTSDTIPQAAIKSANAKQISDEHFVEDLLAELKEEEEGLPSLPAATRPKKQPPVPLQAPRAPPSHKEQEPPSKRGPPRDNAGGRAGEEAGRVVLNHSTHIPGLLPVLHRLVQTSGVRTAVPGRLYTAGANEPGLALRITVPTEGGFKLIARRGSQTQEVFVVTDLERETMQAAIAWAL